MDDVFVDNQPVAVVVDNKGKVKLKVYNFGAYLLNLFVKSVLMFLLLSLNFCLFAKAGAYNVFVGANLSPEIIGILTKMYLFSLAIMFILSFSQILQNLFLALVSGLFVWAMINQFALFDKYDFLSDTFSIYINEQLGDWVKGISYLAAAGIVAAVFFVYLFCAQSSNLLYLSGILFLINAYVLFVAYQDNSKVGQYWVSDYPKALSASGNRKIVHILLSNAAAYPYAAELSERYKDLKSVGELRQIMLGFASVNGFDIYPNAYVTHDSEIENIARVLTLNEENQNQIIRVPLVNKSWNFSRLNPNLVQVKDSNLHEMLQKSGFNASSYRSRFVDTCSYHNEKSVNRCVSKLSMPVRIHENTSLVEAQKSLVSQWIESSALLQNNFKFRDTVLRVLQKLNLIDQAYGKLYVVHSLDVLDKLMQDISKDKGNSYYLVSLDLPADAFVYNEFCMLKPQNEWLKSSDDVGEDKLFDAYARQSACLFGKLQNFIEGVKKINGHNIILLQGISSPDIASLGAKESVQSRFESSQATWLAVFDSKKKAFGIDNRVCNSVDLMKDYFYHQNACQPLNGLFYSKEELETLQGLAFYKIPQSDVNASKRFYALWYKYWLKAQKGEKSVKPEAETLSAPQFPVTSKTILDDVKSKQDVIEIKSEPQMKAETPEKNTDEVRTEVVEDSEIPQKAEGIEAKEEQQNGEAVKKESQKEEGADKSDKGKDTVQNSETQQNNIKK